MEIVRRKDFSDIAIVVQVCLFIFFFLLKLFFPPRLIQPVSISLILFVLLGTIGIIFKDEMARWQYFQDKHSFEKTCILIYLTILFIFIFLTPEDQSFKRNRDPVNLFDPVDLFIYLFGSFLGFIFSLFIFGPIMAIMESQYQKSNFFPRTKDRKKKRRKSHKKTVTERIKYQPKVISSKKPRSKIRTRKVPVEPVHLPYFCQMDNAMIVKDQFAYVCVECNRKICSSCFEEMKQTGMENCILCSNALTRRPAIQLEIDITRVDQMTGQEFENFLEGLFRTQGYQVENIQSSGDHGVDLVVAKGGVRTGVQAKRFKPTSKIGNEVLIKLKGGGYFHDCQKLLVVTTSYYTSKAKEYAEGVGIELWDRKTLENYLSQYDKYLGEK